MAITKEVCLPCSANFCDECYNPIESSSKCCCGGFSQGIPDVKITANSSEQHERMEGSLELKQRGGQTKEDDEVTDPKSTGRKRAAKLLSFEDKPRCEWAGLKNAGGGKFPIIGCGGNLATNRHHGPDKNTLNNSEDNLWGICATCHNRWHTLNDPIYNLFFNTSEWAPHDSETQATAQEIVDNELHWSRIKVRSHSDDQ